MVDDFPNVPLNDGFQLFFVIKKFAHLKAYCHKNLEYLKKIFISGKINISNLTAVIRNIC